MKRELVYRQTSELIPYVNNSRTHSETQVKQVAASIKEFGFTNPVLIDEDGMIIAGHGRVMAAELLSLDEVPTITLEGLTEAQKKAYIIADNKLALNAGWDFEILALELTAIDELNFDLSLAGFESLEVKEILGLDTEEKEAPDDFGEVGETSMDHECPRCGFEFDD